MSIKRKLVCLLAAVIMLATGLTIPVANAEENTSEIVAMLQTFGVPAKASDGYISRGDFTVMAIAAGNFTLQETSANAFDDVSGEQARYIETARAYGIAQGVGNNSFCPDAIITRNEAATIALRVLGYDSFIKEGEYTRRNAILNNLGIFDGVSSDNELTCNNANQLIFNMLEADCAKYTGDTLIGDKPLLYKAHGIYKIHGKVLSVDGIGLGANTDVLKHDVVIDNIIYLNECNMSYEHLGTSGWAYIKEHQGYKGIIFYNPVQANEMVKLISTDIEKAKGFNAEDTAADKNNPYISYIKENGRQKQIHIDATATVYINGKRTTAVSNNSFKPESGTVCIIDTDNGDIVVIDSYSYHVVSGVNTLGNIIVSKNNKPNIEWDKFSENDTEIIYDGQSGKLSDIGAGSVLAVKCSYTNEGQIDTNEPICIEILNSKITGAVTRVHNDYIFLGDTKYVALQSVIEQLNIGEESTFHIGKIGEIIYREEKDGYNDGLEYGYLLKTLYDDNNETCFIIIIDSKGKSRTTTLSRNDKIIYSGMYNQEYKAGRAISVYEIASLFSQKQVVRFKMDGDKLTHIQNAVNNSINAAYEGYDTTRFSLDYAGNSERLYSQILSENYKVNSNTLMFATEADSTDPDDVIVGAYNLFGSDKSGLNVKLYDATTQFMPAVMEVTVPDIDAAIGGISGSFMYDNSATIIYGKYSELNEDGDVVTVLEGYCGGAEVRLEPNDNELKDIKSTNWSGEVAGDGYFKDIEPGDIIQYGTDANGKVNRIHIIHDHSNLASRYIMYNSNNHLSEMNTAFGKVTTYKSDSYFALDCPENGTTRKYPFARTNPTVYVYYTATNSVAKEPSLSYLKTGEYVFVRCRRADVWDIVIYR